jgi:hypothetical protein
MSGSVLPFSYSPNAIKSCIRSNLFLLFLFIIVVVVVVAFVVVAFFVVALVVVL